MNKEVANIKPRKQGQAEETPEWDGEVVLLSTAFSLSGRLFREGRVGRIMTGRILAQRKGKDWNKLTAKEKYNLDAQAQIKDLANEYYKDNGKKRKHREGAILHIEGKGPTRNALMFQAKDRGIKNFRVMNKSELEQVLKPGITQEETLAVAAGAVDRWKEGRYGNTDR